MRSTPELDKVDSRRIRVDAMTKKGEVRFTEEFMRLLDLCDGIGTKGDKKQAKREATIGYVKKKTCVSTVLEIFTRF